uniref:AAA domain-containing protein, putative AbiEii toxin, Type IV TA system n=1 Tax=Candidatus Kentrum sp. TUN TaxID=2126343 RepID=A0A450ZQN5_9GAMM|nr:MAG: AAA domain-containing protein, putative AbiEii toxin, Type IV TA system [Candidatus Kentron sp. TUN]
MPDWDETMTISRIRFEKFTAFEKLDIPLGSGINVLLGANGTGKTHLMKAAYAACDITKTGEDYAKKLIGTFLPSDRALGRLVKRRQGSTKGGVGIYREELKLVCSFSNHAKNTATITGARVWGKEKIESVYIPVKEMLSNAPGFRSLYSQRAIHFEAIYADILDRAYLPPLLGPTDSNRKRLLKVLQEIIEGKVITKDEGFFLRNKQSNLEFSLLAEGLRKLGLLWLLIQNGILLNGSVLFWDEPETNLNPKLFGPLMEILLELQRSGVQIFLATHDYVILKELDLRMKPEDGVLFHSLYRDGDSGEILCHSTDEYLEIHPNAIQETFLDLFDRDVKRDLEA